MIMSAAEFEGVEPRANRAGISQVRLRSLYQT
jgi:hypothetical protein